MTARVLTGSKQEIVDKLTKLEGDVREAIVFVQEPSASAFGHTHEKSETVEEFYQLMDRSKTRFDRVDDSREAIYTRQETE